VLAAFSLALFGVAAGGPLEDGQTAYQKADCATALRLIRPLAEQGNAIAQRSLGRMYFTGQGVPQDDAQALVWFRNAAEQGVGPAQMKLGIMYKLGRGVPQDDIQTYMWVILGLSSDYAGERELDDAAAHGLGVKVRDARSDRRSAADGARVEADEVRGAGALGQFCTTRSAARGCPDQAAAWIRRYSLGSC
jgi:TPR repeat protein